MNLEETLEKEPYK